MAVEGATFIRELTPATPAGGALVSEGDNELTQLKDVFVNQFSGLRADASNIPVTVGADHLNNTPDKSSDTEVIDGNWEFSGTVTYSQTLVMANNRQIVARNVAGTGNYGIASLSAADVLQFGGATAKTEISAGTTDADAIKLTDNTQVVGELDALAGIKAGTRLEFPNVAGQANDPGGLVVSGTGPIGALTLVNAGISVRDTNGDFIGHIRLWT